MFKGAGGGRGLGDGLVLALINNMRGDFWNFGHFIFPGI